MAEVGFTHHLSQVLTLLVMGTGALFSGILPASPLQSSIIPGYMTGTDGSPEGGAVDVAVQLALEQEEEDMQAQRLIGPDSGQDLALCVA